MKSSFISLILIGLASADWILDSDNEVRKIINEEAKKLKDNDELEKASAMSKWVADMSDFIPDTVLHFDLKGKADEVMNLFLKRFTLDPL
jgi:hypothetical protein